LLDRDSSPYLVWQLQQHLDGNRIPPPHLVWHLDHINSTWTGTPHPTWPTSCWPDWNSTTPIPSPTISGSGSWTGTPRPTWSNTVSGSGTRTPVPTWSTGSVTAPTPSRTRTWP
ncbi:hypothetical protein BGX29_005849, partial [Mortierella sp. GBA35]